MRERLLGSEREARGKAYPQQEFVTTRNSGSLDKSLDIDPDKTIFDLAENAESRDPITESIEKKKKSQRYTVKVKSVGSCSLQQSR